MKTYFFTSDGVIKAVDKVNFEINKGESLAVVGESGCGKTTLALSIMRLVPNPPGKIIGGEIIFKGEDLLKKSESEIRNIRGNSIAMSFQDPMTYLNPVMRVGDQIAEVIIKHQNINKVEAMKKTIRTLELVGIASPSKVVLNYPHQLSGGMRQRVVIAIALSCQPELLITDEPTTALDLITQTQIIELLKNLKKGLKTTNLLITHDFGIVSELCDRVVVMYAGNVVENASLRAILKEPAHPYTKGLLESIPRLETGKRRLKSIKGAVPDLINTPPGCKFHPRCPYAKGICSEKEPELVEVNKKHFVACLRIAENWKP